MSGLEEATPAESAISGGWHASIIDVIPDALVVLDETRRRVVAASARYLSLIGAPSDASLEDVHPIRFVQLDDRSEFLRIGDGLSESAIASAPEARVRLEIDEQVLTAAVRGGVVRRGAETAWLYLLRPVESRDPAEAEHQLQTDLTRKAIRSSIQIYYLADQIRSAPKLASHLVGSSDLPDLFGRLDAFLTGDGFRCRRVVVSLFLEGDLEIVHASDSSGMEDGASDFVEEHQEFLETDPEARRLHGKDGRVLLTLDGPQGPIGVLDLLFHAREMKLFQDNSEVAIWHHDVLETVGEIVALFIANVKLVEELTSISIQDPGTGTYNRRFLESQLETELSRSNRTRSELSVVFIDLDDFKQINDELGHRAGDRLLHAVAAILEDQARQSDFVCRYGGDEFVLLLPETPNEGAIRKAEKIREIVEECTFEIGEAGEEASLTLSIGVATTSGTGTARQLLRRADEALYRAKREGRNAVRHS